jgi:O-antigen/teichoic acid export membrane protein
MAEQSLKEKTAKGLFWGGLSNGVQQLLNLFFGIFLSRILTPDDYGMVGMLSIFSLIAGSLQESGFIAALANKREISHKDYNAVFWFSTGLSACLYLILFFCAPLIAQFYNTPQLTALARYSFLGFFIASLGIAHSAYLFRNLMVKQKAIAVTIGLIASGTIGVTMAFLGFAYWGIATQSIVYVGTVNICYWRFSPWRPTLSFDFRPLKGMLSFSSKLLATNIFNHINNNILTVILGKFYSGQEVGYFTQANKWNSMGYSVVSGTVNSVAQPVLSTLSDDRERQQRAFRKMLRFTAFISFPAMLGLSLIAPELIILSITDKWLPSASILQLLCIGGAFIPVTNLYSNLIISKGKSNIYMWNTICLGIIQLVTMLLLYPYGIRTMISIYVAINICWLLVWHYFVWREIRLSLFMALKDVLPFAVIAAGVMAAAYYITIGITNLYLLIISKILIAALLYTAIMWLSRSVTFRESLHYIIKK